MPSAGRASPRKSGSTPAMMRSSVDLPAPLAPSTPILAPGKNARWMPRRISRLGGTTFRRSRMVKMYWGGMALRMIHDAAFASGGLGTPEDLRPDGRGVDGRASALDGRAPTRRCGRRRSPTGWRGRARWRPAGGPIAGGTATTGETGRCRRRARTAVRTTARSRARRRSSSASVSDRAGAPGGDARLVEHLVGDPVPDARPRTTGRAAAPSRARSARRASARKRAGGGSPPERVEPEARDRAARPWGPAGAGSGRAGGRRRSPARRRPRTRGRAA